MSTLATPLRRQLENAIKQARKIAEGGARKALEALAVHEPDPYRHMDETQRALRRKLGAQAKQLGDGESQTRRGAYEIKHLVEKLAYDQWHRLLFARFLVENNLLISPEHGVSVSLDDCEELAPSLRLKDAWAVAARFAATELPEIFRADDPAGAVELPVEDRKPLIQFVTGLPVEVFTASDSLGWCYQFWQAERKEEVNAAGNKIGADELPAVTQLFTEDYMVDFLLDNTLGAWHAGKVLAAKPTLAETAQSEEELRNAVALPGCPWKYLRFIKEPERLAPDTPGQDAPAPYPFFDPHSAIAMHENNLPHWQQGEAWIFATWRLADSLPADKLRDWAAEKEAWLRVHPEPWDTGTEREFHERFSARIEAWLDAGEGSCALRAPAIRRIVQEALHHFDGDRYDLGDFVIMPNHVHALFRPRAGHALGEILHSWKSFTAKKINEAMKSTGAFWQEDYWDRLIRSTRHLVACRHYLAQNPVKAGLRDDEFTLHSKEPERLAPDKPGQDAPAPLWTPAAGTFGGWPKTAKELKCLDPCMGSGHFVVAMFERLVALRMAEEKLDEAAAVAAVIRDNLFGLEIDPRCTQIGAFNLALAAWRRVGHCTLPPMNLACSGLAPNAKKQDWLKLAGDNDRLQRGMARLHALFEDAPVLGSLINPRAVGGDLLEADFNELQPLLEKALAQETKDDSAHEMAVTARGLAKAAEILTGQFTLVATNFPFLGLEKQNSELGNHLKQHFDVSKRELATSFLVRSSRLCGSSGITAAVMPGEWTYARPHRHFRKWLLDVCDLKSLCTLGNDAFATPLRVKPVLAIAGWTSGASQAALIDVRNEVFDKKAAGCANGVITIVNQATWKDMPDARLVSDEDFATAAERLSDYAEAKLGVGVGDGPRFEKVFWELAKIDIDWLPLLGPSPENREYFGRHAVIFWQQEKGEIFKLAQSVKHLNHAAQNWQRGRPFWGRRGLLLSQMGGFTIYTGEIFDGSCLVIMPSDESTLLALTAYAISGALKEAISRYEDVFRIASPQSVLSAPFDLAHWEKVAAEKYPHGLPKPFSSDPTQWLFNGHPKVSDQPLHVAVARLLGYQWPRQTGSSFPDCPALGADGLEKLADEDGIVCLSATKGEAPAAERLRAGLVQALGKFDLSALIASAGPKGSKSETLEEWLRDEFFEQHCAFFHHRPFVWHIWDGHKSGFSALVNYHQLTHANLEKLTYAHLGDWIRRQQAAVDAGEAGSDARLQAAKQLQTRLKLILEGEPPYDLFVRWKPLFKQAIGWHPDINDGVRMNIRPFLSADIPGGKKGAGLLRTKPNIKWEKDRGKEPVRDKKDFPWFWNGSEFTGDRVNDVHLSLAQKAKQ